MSSPKKSKKNTTQTPQLFTRAFWSKRRIIISSFALILSLTVVTVAASTQLKINPGYAAADHKVDAPFVIELGQKISTLALAEIQTAPVVQGQWHIDQGSLLTGDRLVFTPKTYFAVNTEYKISLPVIKRALVGEATTEPIEFKTELAPSLLPTGIAELKNEQVVSAGYIFELVLSSPNRGLRALELRTTPQIDMKRAASDDTTFTWKPADLLPQGQPVQLELYDTKNNVSLLKKVIAIAAEPKLQELPKTTDYRPGDPINLQFSESITPDQKSKITFNTPGEGRWADDKTYAFTPTDLQPGRTYTYVVATGVTSQQGGVTTREYSGSISTVGAIKVTSMTPRGRELSQASQRISVTFSGAVDKGSAQQRLSVSSGTIKSTAWSGNTLIATVVDLGFQQTVVAAVAAGVKNSEFGLPSTQPYSTTFTTEYRSMRLNVPYYRQQYAASCTAASLRMLLARKGIYADDLSIVQQMGYAPRPIDKSTDPGTWDDPHTMFVGSITGSIRGGTGAGPDAQPVANAAVKLGRSASAVTGASTSWLAQQIYAGNGVVLFGALDGGRYISWQTPTGGTARMHETGHARAVTGVVGEPTNPIGFWVSDPLYGERYWSAGALSANMSLDPHRQAVVVY